MKKTILAIAMLFSVVMNAQIETNPFSGIWYGEIGDYHTVILHNDIEGYKFINFSFGEQDSVDEYLVENNSNSLTTRIHNKDNNWNVSLLYTIIDKNTLSVEFSGDYENTIIYHRGSICY
tara:strand:- start:107 stop:466 length:360 start_codon:yes stop_codon:yes gene_type:complete